MRYLPCSGSTIAGLKSPCTSAGRRSVDGWARQGGDRVLTAAERNQFETNGFILGPAVYDPEAMRRVRDELYAVLATTSYAGSATAHRHLDSRTVHDLVAQPAIVERMASLLGPDLLLWHTRFFDKPPGSGPVPWHQDMAFWPLKPDICASVWIAIDRADTGNGCVEVIPGSHRLRVPHVPSSGTGRFGRQSDPSIIDETRKVSIELDPGEFMIFDRWLLHGSPPNDSSRPRLGLAARIVPTWVTIDFDRMSPTFPQLAAQLIRGKDTFRLNRLALAPAKADEARSETSA
ncbi:MAG: phytanoyl-CoA dioxygenase family protein [Bauldia sp.]